MEGYLIFWYNTAKAVLSMLVFLPDIPNVSFIAFSYFSLVFCLKRLKSFYGSGFFLLLHSRANFSYLWSVNPICWKVQLSLQMTFCRYHFLFHKVKTKNHGPSHVFLNYPRDGECMCARVRLWNCFWVYIEILMYFLYFMSLLNSSWDH